MTYRLLTRQKYDEQTLKQHRCLRLARLTSVTVRAALLLVCLTGPFISMASADWLEQSVTQHVDIVFNQPDMTAEPIIISGDISLLTSSGEQLIVASDAFAATIRPVVPRSSPRFSIFGPWRVGFNTTLSKQELESALLLQSGVESAELTPPSIRTLGELSSSEYPDPALNDQFYATPQWNLHFSLAEDSLRHPEDPGAYGSTFPMYDDFDMDLPQAWAITKGDTNIVVAVVDTGVDVDHVEFTGRILLNHADRPGDNDPAWAEPDTCPGLCGVNEDNDDLTDEDKRNFLPTNTTEDDVLMVDFVSGMGDSLTIHSSRSWSADELANWLFSLVPWNELARYAIDSNLASYPVSNGYETRLYVPWDDSSYGAWEQYDNAGDFIDPFVANGFDDDGDFIIDDFGYDLDADLDDDENGFYDDYRGWDFQGNDNDVVIPGSAHGTGIASLIAANHDVGRMAGIAPGIKILPVRSGLSEDAMSYCAARGADIISTSFVSGGSASVVRTVTDDFGIMHTNGSGNAPREHMHSLAANERSIIVGGTEIGGWPWYEEEGQPCEDDPTEICHQGTSWHSTVDISASAVQWGIGLTETGYKTWAGTSFSGPAVAGVLALMKSAYPHWDNDFIRAKLLASTTPIRAFGEHHSGGQQVGADGTTSMVPYEGKLGTGFVNAYRALTFYGDLFPTDPVENPVVYWSGTVHVSGDLTIPQGQELVLAPGTTIKVAQDDITESGVDARIVEWIVEGQLTALGTPGEPITFEIFADDPADFLPGETLDHNPDQLWGHFKFTSLDNVTLEHVEFRDVMPRDTMIMKAAIAAPGETVSVEWTTDHIYAAHAPALPYEQSVRIRASLDGGTTFDSGTVVPIADGQFDWTVPAGTVGDPIVIRAEFLDPNGYVIGYDDLGGGLVRIIAPLASFVNVSDQTGLTIPQGSQPYASVPVDYNHDGDEDLVISYEDLPVSLNRNDGDSGDIATFQQLGDQDLGDGLVRFTRGVTRTDYDNNGVVDLFFAGVNGSRLFEGNVVSPGDLTNETTSLLGAAASVASEAAAWGDYNADGYVDVYVIAEVSDMLLESELGSGGGFTDVTDAAGLYAETDETTSAMWAHLNPDGYLDLVVGWGDTADGNSPTLAWSPYYINDGDDGNGQFTLTDKAGASTGPRLGYLGNIQAVDFADLSGDGFLDIVLARQDASGGGTFGNLITCLNDGSGAMVGEGVALGIHTATPMADVEVSDIDGNGVPDLLGLPSDGSAVQVFTGHGDQASRGYWDATASAALGSGTTYGIAAADFNGDADHDIFLLRPESGPNPEDKEFMWANPLLTGPAPPGSESILTIGFDIPVESIGAANASGLGATVMVVVDSPTQGQLISAQVVDGGSGRGSQGSDRLSFGLAGASTADIHVKWPHGGKQVFDAASMPGFPNVSIVDSHDPEISNTTITSSYIMHSSSSATHTFEWYTLLPGGEPQVHLSLSGRPTSNCTTPLGGGTTLLLDPDDPGVSGSSELIGGAVWRHRVVWNAYCGAPCYYTYIVRNNVAGTIYTGQAKTHFASICAEIHMP